MALFYKLSAKKLLEVRNEIFVKNGIPPLLRNGFEESPYIGMRFGKLEPGIYAYDLCRLTSGSHLETITTYISKGDNWIKIYLNIFALEPTLESLTQLKNCEAIQFHLPPNTFTEMRLRIDDFKGMPLFRTIEYKLKSFYTERGFYKRVNELSNLIENDLGNIDSFVKRWHELHKPLTTDWEGKKINKN